MLRLIHFYFRKMFKIIFGFIVICNLSCSNGEKNNSKNILYSYLLNAYQNTAYFECNKNLVKEFAKFEDQRGDVKTGAFKTPSNNMTFQDILGGEMKITENLLTLSIEVVSIPNQINLNIPPANSVYPEIFYRFNFKTNEHKIYVGIENFSNGTISQSSLNNLTVYVNSNGTVESGCGFANTEGNKITFKCDKTFSKTLVNINENSYFNVESSHRINNDYYQDCF